VVDNNTILSFQAYAFTFAVTVLAIIFYMYIYHLYTSKKKGGKDYEKYANMALNDELDDSLVEKNDHRKKIRRSDR